MKPTQIRELSPEEIATRLAELERERFNLRFRGGTQPLDDPLRLRVIRKDVARLKTEQVQRVIAGKKAGTARTGGK